MRSGTNSPDGRGSLSDTPQGRRSLSRANSPVVKYNKQKRRSFLWEAFDMSIHRSSAGGSSGTWQGFLRGLTETRQNLADVLTEDKYSKRRKFSSAAKAQHHVFSRSTDAKKLSMDKGFAFVDEPGNAFSHRTVPDDSEDGDFQLALKSLYGLRYVVVSPPCPSVRWIQADCTTSLRIS